MIVAMDTFGEVYWFLMQTNTNDRTFAMFLKHLVAKLDNDRPGWRLDTIFQIDGARYHKSSSTISLLILLQVSHIISAPYSYDCSCVENWIARFKDGDLNPDKVKTQKSK